MGIGEVESVTDEEAIQEGTIMHAIIDQIIAIAVIGTVEANFIATKSTTGFKTLRDRKAPKCIFCH